MHRSTCIRSALSILALLTLVATLVQPIAVRAASATSANISEYPLPSPNSSPFEIASGPDGALWFTETAGNRIGRITTSGTITEYPLPAPYSGPWNITSGPDGALWFTEAAIGTGVDGIGRITTSGTITEYPLPTGTGDLFGIASGPDGALWFTEHDRNQIGRITTSGAITEYPLPTALAGPNDIVSGPDGALWFTAYSNQIGRITTSGTVTEYPLPASIRGPVGIASGPDGALWFTEEDSHDSIGRITTSGAITEYPLPTGNGGLGEIASGPDGALWFAEYESNQIGRITTSGAITEYPLPTALAGPSGIVSGPDGALWFTEASAGGNAIGRITASSSSPPPPPSYQLSLTPASQTASVGGQGLVTATLLDGATGAPVANQQLSFRVEAGPNAGMHGACLPSSCTTDGNGQVDWAYTAYTYGTDTVQVWIDSNGNGAPDVGEPQATAAVTWGPPLVQPTKNASWAGYILLNPALQPVSALITVPTVDATCTTTHTASFWVGFDGANSQDTFLPQVGLTAACLASNHQYKDECSNKTSGSIYYLWWEIYPSGRNANQHAICPLRIQPQDRVFVSVQPAATVVTFTAYVVHPDGSTSRHWSETKRVTQPQYTSMECVAEDTLQGTPQRPTPFVGFSPVAFQDCSAISGYKAGTTLLRWNMYAPLARNTFGPEEAQTSTITQNGSSVTFTVTRVGK